MIKIKDSLSQDNKETLEKAINAYSCTYGTKGEMKAQNPTSAWEQLKKSDIPKYTIMDLPTNDVISESEIDRDSIPNRRSYKTASKPLFFRKTLVCKTCGSDEVADLQWKNINSPRNVYNNLEVPKDKYCLICQCKTEVVDKDEFKIDDEEDS